MILRFFGVFFVLVSVSASMKISTSVSFDSSSLILCAGEKYKAAIESDDVISFRFLFFYRAVKIRFAKPESFAMKAPVNVNDAYLARTFFIVNYPNRR